MMHPKIPDDVEDLYPLSDIQQGMVYYSQANPGAGLYHNQNIYHLEIIGFKPEVFKHAVGLMVEKHPMLRTGFSIYDFEQPVQLVRRTASPVVEHFLLAGKERAQQETFIRETMELDRVYAFRVDNAQSLWRLRTFDVGNGTIYLLWSCHHAIMDGWSVASLLAELYHAYNQLLTNPSFKPQKLKSTYRDYIIEQMAEKKSGEAGRFWKKELAGYKRLEFLEPSGDPMTPSRVCKYTEKLDHRLLDRLSSAARRYDTSIRTLCFGAYVFMLHMMAYNDDIVVGLITDNRPLCQDGDKILGCFLNTVPVRIRFSHSSRWSWLDYYRMIDEKLLQLKQYERLSFFEILRILGEESTERNPVFDTVFNFVDFHIYQDMEQQEGNNSNSPDAVPLAVEGAAGTNTLFDFSIDNTFDGFRITLGYSPSVSHEPLNKKLCRYYVRALEKLLDAPKSRACREAILPAEEKRDLLHRFNDTHTSAPLTGSIWERFQRQAEKTPDHIALYPPFSPAGIDSPAELSAPMTYRQLLQKSGNLAHTLRLKGIGPDQIVAVTGKRSAQLVIALLAILKTGAAYLPLSVTEPFKRKIYMFKDCDADALLLTSPSEHEEADYALHIPRHRILVMDEVQTDTTDVPVSFSAAADSLPAYIIYTSGSTGNPKGVMVEHRQVLNCINWMQETFCLQADNRVLLRTPLTFDPSVWEIFWPLSVGAGILLTNENQGKDAEYILRLMQENRDLTLLYCPASLVRAIALLLKESKHDAPLVVPWLLTGAEPMDRDTVDTIYARFKGRLVNTYGPTEGTINNTYHELERQRDSSTVVIGKPVANNQVYILSREMELMPVEGLGEICIAGESLARGYVNNPEQTARGFIKNPLGPGRLYRTGDCGRWLPDGTIDIMGRLDRQIKIRGYRVELAEIESRLCTHDAVKEATVVVKQVPEDDTPFLCAYVVLRHPLQWEQLSDFLAKELPNHMIPTHFAAKTQLPLTSNGKLDRRSLEQEPMIHEPTGAFIAPEGETEETLAALWAEVLKREKKHISRTSHFFRMGGHSLNAISLVARIQKTFSCRIALDTLFVHTTLKELAQFIRESEKSTFIDLEKASKKEYYELSPVQKQLYVLQQWDKSASSYNMPTFVVLEGHLDKEHLLNVFKTLIRRHESLRTRFITIQGEPVQQILDNPDFGVEYHRETVGTGVPGGVAFDARVKKFVRAFDLSRAPLLRVSLVKVGETSHILMVDMHHIISDGESMKILIREFTALYNGETLPPLKYQYKDYSEALHSTSWQQKKKAQQVYWLKEFSRLPSRLTLPLDYARPDVQRFEGRLVSLELTRQETEALERLASTTDATLYMVLIAAFGLLISKVSGAHDLVVGTPVAGRGHVDLEGIMGMFVNTLAVRIRPAVNLGFSEYLQELKQKILNAFANQDYPFDDLVDKLGLKRDSSRNPLFDVMFVLQDGGDRNDGQTIDHKGKNISVKPYDYMDQTAKFDLTLFAIKAGQHLEFKFEYNTALFKRKTVERFSGYFQRIITAVLQDSEQTTAEIEIIDGQTRQQLLQKIDKHPHGQEPAAAHARKKTVLAADFDF